MDRRLEASCALLGAIILISPRRVIKGEAYYETAGFNPNEEGIFRPGTGKTQNPVINETFGIEICAEHARGVLANQIREEQQRAPLIHFILSDSKGFDYENFACNLGQILGIKSETMMPSVSNVLSDATPAQENSAQQNQNQKEEKLSDKSKNDPSFNPNMGEEVLSKVVSKR